MRLQLRMGHAWDAPAGQLPMVESRFVARLLSPNDAAATAWHLARGSMGRFGHEAAASVRIDPAVRRSVRT